jgi:hypothetical protein
VHSNKKEGAKVVRFCNSPCVGFNNTKSTGDRVAEGWGCPRRGRRKFVGFMLRVENNLKSEVNHHKCVYNTLCVSNLYMLA